MVVESATEIATFEPSKVGLLKSFLQICFFELNSTGWMTDCSTGDHVWKIILASEKKEASLFPSLSRKNLLHK